MVIVKTNHPLKSLNLIRLQLTPYQNTRLLRNRLLNPMRNIVIIDLVLVLLFLLVRKDRLRSKPALVNRSIAGCTAGTVVRSSSNSSGRVRTVFGGGIGHPVFLLYEDGGGEGVEEGIGLTEEVGDTSVFGGVDELEVTFFIVRSKRFETLLADPLNPLLFLLLRIRMKLQQRLPKLAKLRSVGPMSRLEVSSMRDDFGEMIEVFLFRSFLTVTFLRGFEGFEGFGGTDGGGGDEATGTTEEGSVEGGLEGEGGDEGLEGGFAQGLLEGEKGEGFELD